MKVGIVTEQTGFGTLKRWEAVWTCKDGVSQKVVKGSVISEEDQDSPTIMNLHKETFARVLGLAIIQDPPKDGD